MAYDEGLAERIAELLPKAVQKKMFGGVGFMERGNLVVGVIGDEMIARVGPDDTAKALKEEGVRTFDFTGKTMKGWVVVAQAVLPEDEESSAWVKRCQTFTRTLPAK